MWHGNIIPQEDSRTNSKEMKELLGYMEGITRTWRIRQEKCIIIHLNSEKVNIFLSNRFHFINELLYY